MLDGSTPSFSEEVRGAFNGMVIGPLEGSCGTAVYNKKLTIVEDISTDPRWEKFKDFAHANGLKACTHWVCLDDLEAMGAKAVRKRFIKDGKMITASGVSAGIDMSLYIVKTLVSKKQSLRVLFGIEYFPNKVDIINSYSIPRTVLRKMANYVRKVYWNGY